MKEQLISFETAKLAKEKGFDVEVFRNYLKENLDDFNEFNSVPFNFNKAKDEKGNFIKNHPFSSAPTQSLLQKWLREEYNIDVEPRLANQEYKKSYYFTINQYNDNYRVNLKDTNLRFNIYEEALEVGLQEALKLIKN